MGFLNQLHNIHRFNYRHFTLPWFVVALRILIHFRSNNRWKVCGWNQLHAGVLISQKEEPCNFPSTDGVLPFDNNLHSNLRERNSEHSCSALGLPFYHHFVHYLHCYNCTRVSTVPIGERWERRQPRGLRRIKKHFRLHSQLQRGWTTKENALQEFQICGWSLERAQESVSQAHIGDLVVTRRHNEW